MVHTSPSSYSNVDSALPSPRWRWQWIIQAAENRLPFFQPAPDPSTREARGYWQARQRCRGDAERAILSAKRPALESAVRLAEGNHGRLRHALEARVLAGETPSVIALKTGLADHVIRWYEHLFFDVRRFLDQTDYILQHALVQLPEEGSEEFAWKVFGYLVGPAALDLLMGAPARPRPPSSREAADYLVESAGVVIRARAALASRIAAADDPSATAEMVRAVLRSSGTDRNEQVGTQEALMARHIRAMLDEIPWSFGANGEASVDPVIAKYDRGAVELHDDELLRCAAGEKLPELDQFENFELPPPSTRKSSPLPEALLDS